MLKPITKTKSELDDELKELEVENSAGGKDGGGGWNPLLGLTTETLHLIEMISI